MGPRHAIQHLSDAAACLTTSLNDLTRSTVSTNVAWGRSVFHPRMVRPRQIALVLSLPCLTAGIPGAQIAAAAPAQLLNKTVVVSWSRDVTEKGADGHVINIRRNDTREIYVSTAGRLFVRIYAQVNRTQRRRDLAPGDDSTPAGPQDAHFEGKRLLLTSGHQSGASRLAIDFDPGFTSCAPTFTYGKEGGAPIVWKGVDGATYEVISNTVISSSCEIKDGNLFAGR